MILNKIGQKRLMNNGQLAEIINYRNCNDIDIKFEDGVIRKGVRYDKFIEGKIKNLYALTIFGVACVGETNTIDKNSNVLPSYRCWYNMIQRCYNTKHSSYKSYGEKGVRVCEEWLCYKNFKKWYDHNIYQIEKERVCLDKDILVRNNKMYSPETCIFVPERINLIFEMKDRKTNLPLGVCKNGNKYMSRINDNGNVIYLGSFDTPEEAHELYLKERLKIIKQLAKKYKHKIPKKLYDRLIEIGSYCNNCDGGDE